MKRPRTIRAADLLASAKKGPSRAGRSPLYVWMRDNHADLLAGFTRDRPDWQALCEAFGRAGLLDRTGKPPKPETARKTWQTVRKDVGQQAPVRSPDRLPVSASHSHPAEPVSRVDPAAAPAPRPRMALRPARVADPNVQPEHDGSQLPRPINRSSHNED